MTNEQKRISDLLAADGFPLVPGAVAVLHKIEGEIYAAVGDDGMIDLVRPTGRGMVPIEAHEVPHRFRDVVILGHALRRSW